MENHTEMERLIKKFVQLGQNRRTSITKQQKIQDTLKNEEKQEEKMDNVEKKFDENQENFAENQKRFEENFDKSQETFEETSKLAG